MDAYGQLLDDLTRGIEDPAEVFACSFRLTGRLQRREPELSRIFLNNVLRLLSADSGLAQRARRDIKAAVDAGRFDVEDLDIQPHCSSRTQKVQLFHYLDQGQGSALAAFERLL